MRLASVRELCEVLGGVSNVGLNVVCILCIWAHLLTEQILQASERVEMSISLLSETILLLAQSMIGSLILPYWIRPRVIRLYERFLASPKCKHFDSVSSLFSTPVSIRMVWGSTVPML